MEIGCTPLKRYINLLLHGRGRGRGRGRERERERERGRGRGGEGKFEVNNAPPHSPLHFDEKCREFLA